MLIEIKHIRLIVGIHNQQAGIIECCLVLLLGMKGDGAVGWEGHRCRSLDYLVIIAEAPPHWEIAVPVWKVAHLVLP